jgi:uncharacterized membrane protein YphA (DoxX/SURF4 family)
MVLGFIFAGFGLTLLPFAATSPFNISLRTIVFEVLSIAGGAFVLASAQSHERRLWLNPKQLGLIGRILFAFSLVIFGIDHWLIPSGIAGLIPFWIPFPLFWAWFTGASFIAGGIAIVAGWKGRLGAFLIGLMFLLWVLLLHGPRTLGILKAGAGPRSPAEWSSLFIALAIGGASWICAESLPDFPMSFSARPRK